jgi:hypothetical protein
MEKVFSAPGEFIIEDLSVKDLQQLILAKPYCDSMREATPFRIGSK